MDIFKSNTKRTALFIDGANLHASLKALGGEMDYAGLIEWFQHNTNFIRALYYTAVTEGDDYSSLRPLLDWLQYNGFQMVTKPVKEFENGAGEITRKGNMDVELVLGAMNLAPHIDVAVIFSGDGDFKALVEELQRKGKIVVVVSTMVTTADELRRQCDVFLELKEFTNLVRRSRE